MGAVYRAVSGDADGREVAIKLIKCGMDTGTVLRRFQTERRILAELDHPNIAHLLDDGTTPDGHPYVVMEFVRGVPITAYCDRNRLTITERLRLFRKVCSAVACAHQHNIIHRDIKPGNILVTAEGEPKLLDFGIAKVLESDVAAQDVTVTVLPVMTPQYASPEQARGEPVTAATDIYSLGVLLYELLTGHRPYQFKSRSPHDILHAICEQEPERPSQAVYRPETRTGDPDIASAPDRVSRVREGSPEALHRRLAGDLDNILLVALRKEPERRYASVEKFSDDIRRHLDGLAPIARREWLRNRPPSWRKIRIGAVAAVLIILAAAVSWMAYRGFRERSVQVRRSVAVLGFENLSRQPENDWLSTALTEMLSTELAAGGKLRTVSGEQVSRVKLELSVPNAQTFTGPTLARLRRSLNADYIVTGAYLATGKGPDLKVRLDVRLQDTAAGEVISAVSEIRGSTDLLSLASSAGARFRRQLGIGEREEDESGSLRRALPDDPVAARRYAEGLERLRTFDMLGARELLKAAVQAAPRHALSHSALALASGLLGYDAEARAEARKALDLSANLSREDRLFIEGRYYESMGMWAKAVETFRGLRNEYPDNLEYGLRLATALTKAGDGKNAAAAVAALRKLPAGAQDPRLDLAEAEAALAISDLGAARAAAARAINLGIAQGSRVLAARAHLLSSRILIELGDPQSALEAARESRYLYEAAKHRQGVAWALNEAAAVLNQQGDVATARNNYDEALEICRTIGDQTCIANDLDSIGVLLRRQGELEAALNAHEQALAVRRMVGDRAGVATALYNLGNVLEKLGNLRRAREMDAQALELRRSLGQKRAAALTLSRLANVRRLQGALEESTAMQHQAVSTLRRIGDRGGTAMALNNLAIVWFERGDLRSAREAWEEALMIRRQQRDKNNTAEVLSGLASAALAEGKLDQARNYLNESMSLRRGLGERHSLAQDQLLLAEVTLEQGQNEQAEKMAGEAEAQFEHEHAHGYEAAARLVLTRCLMAQHKMAEAEKQLKTALALLHDSEDRKLHLLANLATARLNAARGGEAVARPILARARDEARRSALVHVELQIRLALVQLGAEERPDLARDARQTGFLLIAQKASLAAGRPQQPK